MAKYDRTGGFTSFGEFLSAVRRACVDGRADARLKTAGHMAEAVDSQGGFLVPETWADGIYTAAIENEIVRIRALVFKSKSDSLKLRTLVESTRASTLFGGVTFYWTAEAADKSLSTVKSKPAVGEIELNLHKLVGSLYSSNELMDDYGNFGYFMEQSFGRALRFIEDDVFIWGTGGGQPLGIMNSGALVQVTRTALNRIDITDIGNMAARLLPGCWGNAVWLINQSVLADWANLTAGAANAAAAIDLSTMTCLGLPIIVTEKCSALGTTGDIILADFSQYAISDGGLEIAASREVYGSGGSGFLTDETFWRVVLRVDGQPIYNGTITPHLGGAAVGPFVALTTSS